MIKKLRGFIRASYYRRFIRGFDIISKPLTDDLLKKNTFKWSSVTTDAFEQLKEDLTKTLVLVLPNENKTNVIETNAVRYDIGIVLMQQGYPIAFIGKTLSPRHSPMFVYDRELLAIVYAISKWSPFFFWTKIHYPS